MAGGSGIYISWLMGAILLSVALMPLMKPPWAKIRIQGFVDMFRRYWAHMFVVFSVYLWKDLLDQLDRILMANTQLDMTPYVYAIEGDIVLWIQDAFQNELLSIGLTHFYVMGFMTATFASFVYPIYFDDRHMADRVSLSMFWVYVLAIPFYLFFNVRVTGDHIPAMETIAYDLTPEIHNWFTRIDPFTNGMPSLHIGLPFAVWLTYLKWDEDGRWAKFRTALMVFIILTGFTILYLGIHWVVDIIGGILVATLAVSLTERTHEPVWRFADERLFTRRLARFMKDPRAWFRGVKQSVKRQIDPYREPSKTQTGAVIVAILIGTGLVLLWDATHQDFPVEGVTPTYTAGSGDWLVTVQENDNGTVDFISWSSDSRMSETISTIIIGEEGWTSVPRVTASEKGVVIFDNQKLEFWSFNYEDQKFNLDWLREENNPNSEPIIDVLLAENAEQEAVVAVVYSEELVYRDREGLITEYPSLEGPFNIVASSGSQIAIANSTESGPVLEIISLSTQFTARIDIGDTTDEDVDEFLEDLFEERVDYTNSTIVDLVMEDDHIVAVVDIGPVNRTILIDLRTGVQILLSDPVWPSSSPSISEGNVAFLQIPRFDPTAEDDDLLTARDVFLHDIDENRTLQLTIDDEVDQSNPQVLKSNVAWIESQEDGDLEIRMYALEETFEPYSSVVLQSSIVLLIPMMILYAFQSAKESSRFNFRQEN
ncbi:MAG: phosphatase PAP2 family protein [Candidatus Thermoplasmatota archaeon]|nr:phosphatase PAP2 family protein [Candidatus Thermoplasmatota archaeon]